MIYVVQSGDSLTSIAKRYGVSLERLRSDNGLLPEQPLVPGQALVVFIPKETYQVRSGDTIYGIARQAGISARELIQRNPSLAQGAPLTVGEHLTLRPKEEPEGSLMVNGYAYPHIEQRVLRAGYAISDGPVSLFLWISGGWSTGSLGGQPPACGGLPVWGRGSSGFDFHR